MRQETKEEKVARIRADLATRNWHQPSSGFKSWWEPHTHNRVTGAEVGGHPAAYRKCVHAETREIRYYGIKTVVAFNDRHFREEYLQWIKGGCPEREVMADGTTAPRDDSLACLANIKNILKDSPIMSKFQECKAIMEGEE